VTLSLQLYIDNIYLRISFYIHTKVFVGYYINFLRVYVSREYIKQHTIGMFVCL